MAATETKEPQTTDDVVVDETEQQHTDGPKETIFDASQYDDPELQLPQIDGQSIDKIRISFTGNVMLDRADKADVALFRKLSLGKGGVTLMVEGRCSSSGGKQNTNREGDLDVIVGDKTVKVESVYISTAEGLHKVTADDIDGGEAFDEPGDD